VTVSSTDRPRAATVVVGEQNLDIYGAEDIPWSVPLSQLEAGRAERFWLATSGPAGRPHLNGVGARWFDGTLYFTSGARTRKSRNLEMRAHCVIAAELPELDLTFEGRAKRVADPATVERLARHYASTGWPARARDGSIDADYSAPSAGPPPWALWAMTPVAAVGVGAAGAMRWRFGPDRG
jgi:hypothetical protein